MRRWLLLGWLVSSASPVLAQTPPPGAVPVPPALASALAPLGPEVRAYTSKARPLTSLADIRVPEQEVAIDRQGLGRGLQAVLRAGGVPLRGGAYGVARLVGPNHFAGAFRPSSRLRLLLIAGTDPAPAGRALAPATSFGPLAGAALRDAARLRVFEPMNLQVSERQARAGHQLLVVSIDRDFGRGLGTLSFLFGSGFILEPDFGLLAVTATGGRRFSLVGTHAEGPKLDLVYEVPRGARGLALVEGDARWPLDAWLGGAQADRPAADCARARADLAALERKYLERHPMVLAGVQVVETACARR